MNRRIGDTSSSKLRGNREEIVTHDASCDGGTL